jgi:hypothetical protein
VLGDGDDLVGGLRMRGPVCADLVGVECAEYEQKVEAVGGAPARG